MMSVITGKLHVDACQHQILLLTMLDEQSVYAAYFLVSMHMGDTARCHRLIFLYDGQHSSKTEATYGLAPADAQTSGRLSMKGIW